LYWGFQILITPSLLPKISGDVAYYYVRTPSLKMTRDPTLMALSMELDEVKHFNDDGLCNAVTLSSRDGKLGRMKWKEGDCGAGLNMGLEKEACCGKVVLVHDNPKDESAGTIPLLPLRCPLTSDLP
jgi:hypothetical protein